MHKQTIYTLFVDWFRAVQAMLSIGLITLLVSLLLIAIYMCIHTVSKNSTIIALVCFCILSGESGYQLPRLEFRVWNFMKIL